MTRDLPKRQIQGCACASCQLTNRHMESGFGAWPTGNPAGRKSSADYAAHVRACLSWGPLYGKQEVPPSAFTRDPFPCNGTGWSDPGARRKYPGEADATKGTAAYVAAFLKANGYRGMA